MNLDHLRYFVTLAGIQHYTKAAEMLSITQPSLSHAIAQMEDELGVPLFAKSGRNVVLTQYGEHFLQYTKKSLEILDEGIEAVRRNAGQNVIIRMGFCTPLGAAFVPRMSAGFLKKHPNTQFSFREDDAPHLWNGLAAGEYDVIFCEAPISKPEFEIFPVHRKEWVLIVQKGSALAKRKEITLQEIADERLILFPKGTMPGKTTELMFENAGVSPQVVYEADSKSAMAGLVAQGLGVALVLKESAEQMSQVDAVPLNPTYDDQPFCMIHAKKKFMPETVRDFCKYVYEQSVVETEKPDSSVG